MPSFSNRSATRLRSAHSILQDIFFTVIEIYDCTILEGHRGKEKQNKAFEEGKSKVKWPDGKHNKNPSWAVDAAPYPIDWEDYPRFYHFAGIVKGVALAKGYNIRWGGDWDGDLNLSEERFKDLVHFEVVE